MERRRFLLTSLAGALAAQFAAQAQQAGKVWRVGFLGTSSASDYAVFLSSAGATPGVTPASRRGHSIHFAQV